MRNTIEPNMRCVSRRGCLQAGVLGAGLLGGGGCWLPEVLLADTQPGGRVAKNCLLFFLEGGPSHIDLWDMKPQAPVEIRGDFEPIATTVSGSPVCEHLGLLSRQWHHLAQIRSVHHQVNDHNAGAYYALTGRSPVQTDGLIVGNGPDNAPHIGSVLSRLRPLSKLPPFVHLPEYLFNNGNEIPGQAAGFLGAAYDPLLAGDPSVPGYRVPGIGLPRDVSPQRLRTRRQLLDQLQSGRPSWGREATRLGRFRERAYNLLHSEAAHRAFDLSRESPKTHERYGIWDQTKPFRKVRDFGGLPHLGQSLLLARRLIEAGVRLVTVCTGHRYCQSWDTHRKHFPLLKRSLLPYTDRAFSALLEDMYERGLLEETLVVAMGEFGRTPRVGQITSSAGADPAGRDHWPHCYTVLMGGAGIRGGMIYGASDRYGAHPERYPVSPEDIAATIFHALGITPGTRIPDKLGRPHSVAVGKPILELF